jgi:hypothetical protein
MTEREFLNEAIRFTERFVTDEHNLWQEAYLSADDAAFWSHRDAFNAEYFSGDIETNVRKPRTPSPEWLADAKDSISVLQKRPVFQVKLYRLPEYGLVVGSYLGGRYVGNDSYFELLLLAQHGNALKIITQNLSDQEGYFDYLSGVEFEELPKPIEIIKFQPPSDPADLAEYNAE